MNLRSLLAVILTIAPAALAQPLPGIWQATLTTKEGDIPFRLEVAGEEADVDGWFYNGDQKSAEVNEIIEACDAIGRTSYERLRAKAMALALRYTALRIGDVSMLARDRISEVGNRWRMFLPIPGELKDALDALPIPRGADRECRERMRTASVIRWRPNFSDAVPALRMSPTFSGILLRSFGNTTQSGLLPARRDLASRWHASTREAIGPSLTGPRAFNKCVGAGKPVRLGERQPRAGNSEPACIGSCVTASSRGILWNCRQIHDCSVCRDIVLVFGELGTIWAQTKMASVSH